MISVGYHYISKLYWDELQRDESKKVLTPHRRLIRLRSITDEGIPDLPVWAHEAYIFAFPDFPGPKSWEKYPHYKKEWAVLTRDIGSQFIELVFNIMSKDKAFVVDRAHLANYQWGYSKDRQEALRRYAFSRIPAGEYVGQFTMPELIIQNGIELERLKVSGEV